MKEYFSDIERENLITMLRSLDQEQVKLALSIIENSPDYNKFKNYHKFRGYTDTLEKLCKICYNVMQNDVDALPYAAEIISWGLE